MKENYEYLETMEIESKLYPVKLEVAGCERSIGITLTSAEDRDECDKFSEFIKGENIMCIHGPSSEYWDAENRAYKEKYNKFFDEIVKDIEKGKINKYFSEYIYGMKVPGTNDDLECSFS